jgi:hypothetical protein
MKDSDILQILATGDPVSLKNILIMSGKRTGLNYRQTPYFYKYFAGKCM